MTTQKASSKTLRRWALGLLGIGAVLVVVSRLAAGTSEIDFYRGWLIGFLFCWEATMGCLGILMLHHLMGGNWGRASRPALEAGAGMVPVVAIAFLPIAFYLEEIFPWTGDAAANDPLIELKSPYLNSSAFYTRAAIYFVIWFLIWCSLVLGKRRNRSTNEPPPLFPRRSALGTILLVVTMSFAAIDWGMSLEPHWFSSIYGALYIAGGAVVALALVSVAVSVLRVSEPLAGISRRQIRRDLGSILLAWLMIWAYFAFSQFLIIWAADLPEENFWYLKRAQQGWQYLAVLIAVSHFFLPFAFLISQDVREHPWALTGVAGLVLVAHAIQLVWTIAPAFYEGLADTPWWIIATLVGMFSLWTSVWLLILRPPAIGLREVRDE